MKNSSSAVPLPVEVIKRSGLRVTKPRIKVMECLFDGNHLHQVSDIIKHINSKGEKINTKTAYNVLDEFLEVGLVRALGDGRYESQLHEGHVHVLGGPETSTIPFDNQLVHDIKEFAMRNKLDLKNFYLEINLNTTKSK